MNTTIDDIPLCGFDLSLSEIRVMNHKRICQVEKSLRLHGQLQPIVARIDGKDCQIIDGFKRYYAAESLGMKNLQCRLLKINLAQAKVLLLSYNRPHQSMEAWEEALVLKDLQSTHSLDQRSLSRMIGYSVSWVSRRLALVEKMDESISSGIMMGELTGSHARALVKLPRGKQAEVAKTITTHRLTSRQSEVLAKVFLKAKDKKEQDYILAHAMEVIEKSSYGPQKIYDIRLSGSANELLQSSGHALQSLYILLSGLKSHYSNGITRGDKIILTPHLQKVSDCCSKLTEIIVKLK
jgi:ParB family transcriptional regulator, chromosome partitioning protein